MSTVSNSSTPTRSSSISTGTGISSRRSSSASATWFDNVMARASTSFRPVTPPSNNSTSISTSTSTSTSSISSNHRSHSVPNSPLRSRSRSQSHQASPQHQHQHQPSVARTTTTRTIIRRRPSAETLDLSTHNLESPAKSASSIIRDLKLSNAKLTNRLATNDAKYLTQMDALQRELEEFKENESKLHQQLVAQEMALTTCREQSAFQRHELSTIKRQIMEEQTTIAMVQQQQQQQPKPADNDKENNNGNDNNDDDTCRISATKLYHLRQSLKELQTSCTRKDETIQQLQDDLESTKESARAQDSYRQDEVEDLRVLLDAQEEELVTLRQELDGAQRELEFVHRQSRQNNNNNNSDDDDGSLNSNSNINRTTTNSMTPSLSLPLPSSRTKKAETTMFDDDNNKEKEKVKTNECGSITTTTTPCQQQQPNNNTIIMRNHVSKQQQQIPLGEEEGSLNTTELTVAISMDEEDEPSISPHDKVERHVIALTNDDDENDENDDFSSSYSSDDGDNGKEEEVWSRQLKAKLLEAQTLTERLKQVEYNLKQKEQALLKSSENSRILQLQGLLAATQREKEWLEEQHSQTRQNHQRQLQSLAEQFAALQQQRRGERGEQQSTSSRRHSGLTTSLSSGDRHRRRHDNNRDDVLRHQHSTSSQQQQPQQSEQSQQQPRSFKYIFDEPYDGRLGLILQADDNVVSHKRRVGRGGGPVVHGIRESSPLAGLVQVGDKIVEVDGKDTTKCGLSEIVHLLSCRRSDSSGRIMFERYYAESMRLGVGSGNDGYGHDDNSI